MGRELNRELPAARQLFDQANEILGFDLRASCFDGPAEALAATDVSQPAIFVASLAALEGLKVSNPAAVESCEGAAGLSLGEYTALVFAGALSFEDGLKVVQRRGLAMQAAAIAAPSGMTSVLGLDEAAVDVLCQRIAPHGRLWKANLLGPGNIVVSGDAAALPHVEAVATELGASRVIPLVVAGAFHTPLMKPADDQLAETLAVATFQPPRIPVYSNVGRRAALRARRPQAHLGGAGGQRRALGRIHPPDVARRLRRLPRDRSRSRTDGPFKAHRPENFLHKCSGAVRWQSRV